MKIVASVQSKRGSSRGLVHYIAHSKLDAEREPQSSRELFNAFADDLSVKSANNSMRVGIAKGRPSNDDLHHLVLSFRDEDYRKLGADEARRRRSLKEITRAAMKRLETATNAERLLWTAAVHRNTENPHVHIAIQKRYLTKEIERQILTKIPRETLPHYEIRNGEKILVHGHLIDALLRRWRQLWTASEPAIRFRNDPTDKQFHKSIFGAEQSASQPKDRVSGSLQSVRPWPKGYLRNTSFSGSRRGSILCSTTVTKCGSP